jgi:hypothetical protein
MKSLNGSGQSGKPFIKRPFNSIPHNLAKVLKEIMLLKRKQRFPYF